MDGAGVSVCSLHPTRLHTLLKPHTLIKLHTRLKPHTQVAAVGRLLPCHLNLRHLCRLLVQVVILGDTIVSAPIAPLAHGCDIISHEATFMQGEQLPCTMCSDSGISSKCHVVQLRADCGLLAAKPITCPLTEL